MNFFKIFVASAALFSCAIQGIGNVLPADSLRTEAQYAVYFTDKNGTPYSIDNPLEFLSQRALDRRELRGIPVNEEDLPVNPTYVDGLEEIGASVSWTSRWANLAMVYASETIIDAIASLSYVDSIVYIKPGNGVAKNITPKFNKWDDIKYTPVDDNTKAESEYGYGEAQLVQLNGKALHDNGLRGEDVLIAVIDAGFCNTDKIDAFDHLFENGKIVFEKDIVDKGGDIYLPYISDHGTAVLSTMGAVLPNVFVGTAPDASYALIRTEDSDTEYLIEEYNWLIGAEMADSIGADIVNTSLGYSTFDDPSMIAPYSTMDGNTAISSIAARMLTERGVHFVTSAGNSNGTSWPWVGTPSDVVEGLTIGAVDINGQIAYFSSIGPNGAGDQKPNTVACGYNCIVINGSGQVSYSAGTSFSSPITCGLVACLVGGFPQASTDLVKSNVEYFADRYNNPNYTYGYGLPDFGASMFGLDGIGETKSSSLKVYPNPTSGVINISSETSSVRKVAVFDVLGRCLSEEIFDGKNVRITIEGVENSVGIVKIEMTDGSIEVVKVVVK